MTKLDSNIYSLMQTGKPYKSYIKTALGKLYVTVLNSFSGEPEGRILQGNTKNLDEKCIVDVWDEREDVFFRRVNKKHFDTGNLIEFKRTSNVSTERSPNEFTEDEIIELLNSKFLTLQSRINKITSIAPIYRFVTLAKEMEKSEKIIKFLEGKMAEIQELEYTNLGE